MEKVEHTGREWSVSLFAGREKRRVFRWVDKESGEKKWGSGSFIGRLVKENGEESGEVRCGWLEDGDIEVVFPAMEAGRYGLVIDFVGSGGKVVRFLNGWVGYLEPEYVFREMSEVQDAITVVCMGERDSEVWVLAGDAADYNAERAIEAAERAEEARDEVLRELDQAIKFQKGFQKALQECVRVYENYLWIGDYNTGHYLKGEDAPIPEYRSDGYLYINDKPVAKIKGEDGITPHITADGYWALGSQKTTVRAEGRDGKDGVSVRRVLIDSVNDLPKEKEEGVMYYVQIGEKLYDVYVWLDNANRWVNVKETYDIATDQVHGLMKFTAGAITDGAPVGWKEDDKGAAMVPLADPAVPGVGKIGTSTVIARGAGVGFDRNGAFFTPAATVDAWGTIKLGTSTIQTDGGMLGLNTNGQAIIPPAGYNSYGVVKLSTSLNVSNNDAQYLVSIGRHITQKTIAINALTGGALKYRHGNANGWTENNAPGAGIGALKEDEKYLGVATTKQFSQESGELKLLSAMYTAGEVGGVRLSVDMEEEGLDVVPSAAVVRQYFENKYGLAPDVLTREQAIRLITEMLQAYATQEWVQNAYANKASIESALRGKMSCQPGVCEKTVWLSSTEFAALKSVDPLTEYKIYAG